MHPSRSRGQHTRGISAYCLKGEPRSHPGRAGEVLTVCGCGVGCWGASRAQVGAGVLVRGRQVCPRPRVTEAQVAGEPRRKKKTHNTAWRAMDRGGSAGPPGPQEGESERESGVQGWGNEPADALPRREMSKTAPPRTMNGRGGIGIWGCFAAKVASSGGEGSDARSPPPPPTQAPQRGSYLRELPGVGAAEERRAGAEADGPAAAQDVLGDRPVQGQHRQLAAHFHRSSPGPGPGPGVHRGREGRDSAPGEPRRGVRWGGGAGPTTPRRPGSLHAQCLPAWPNGRRTD